MKLHSLCLVNGRHMKLHKLRLVNGRHMKLHKLRLLNADNAETVDFIVFLVYKCRKHYRIHGFRNIRNTHTT